MKAVVLAGGYATRLWPITKNRPKMFLPIGETTVIDRIFDELERDDRIDTVYVSTNERFEAAFETHLAESTYEKPELSIEETRAEGEKFGVVGALAQLIDREEIADDLLVIAGDNLLGFDVSDFLEYFDQKESPVIAAYDVGSVDRASEYGIVDLDGDRVVDFQEKPDQPKSTLVSIACYAFTEDTLPLLPTYLDGDNNPDEPGWFVQWLQRREPTYAFTFEDAWFDIGTPESYLDAVGWYLDGESLVAESATLDGATIGENVHVMADAMIENTTLENAVIFPNVTLRNAEIRASIVDENTLLEDVNLAEALIGAHTQISTE
ncbi:sugar phosphate nucleotidyltransferase [Halovivax gelatinilyticus]|uniref:sugar phosphate nucleotidyltransferase n=1 Tax=Halovivax gelatinilyticus TaxID=2961597 RepID=UPI0020CA2BA3|nr:NDP-sugar synthase [Halovivax gelatinilyticus]